MIENYDEYTVEENKTESEFGKGTVYCLCLFLSHAERDRELHHTMKDDDFMAELWFNGASDHLYELIIPDNFPEELKNRMHDLKDKCLRWGHGFRGEPSTYKDIYWAIQETKDILFMIDRFYGIRSVKASWE